jgi:hypothetical protein
VSRTFRHAGLDPDPIAVLLAPHFDRVRLGLVMSALFYDDEHFRSVPRPDLDGPVECGEIHIRLSRR